MKQFENKAFFALVEEELKNGKAVRFRVKGSSMYPLLRDGKDEVLVKPYTATTLKKGDIVLFKCNGQHILHRFKTVLKTKKATLYKMQGDNVIGKCEICTEDGLIGIVATVYRQKADSHQTVSPHSRRWQLAGIIRRCLLQLSFTMSSLNRR